MFPYFATTHVSAEWAQPILGKLRIQYGSVPYACFWNECFAPSGIESFRVAPIIRSHIEPCDRPVHLIMAEQYIPYAIVVRTNLTHLVERLNVQCVTVVYQKIAAGAEAELRDEIGMAIAKFLNLNYETNDLLEPLKPFTGRDLMLETND